MQVVSVGSNPEKHLGEKGSKRNEKVLSKLTIVDNWLAPSCLGTPGDIKNTNEIVSLNTHLPLAEEVGRC